MSESAHDDERLSAYLDGQLSASETAALEAACAADPVLAAELDTVADVLVTLRELDKAVPPPGFTDRLRQRLASEVDHEAPTVPGAIVQLPPRRTAWPVIGSAAAAVVLLALLTNGVILRGPSVTADPLMQTERAAAQFEAPDLARDRVAMQVVDSEAVLPDAVAVRRHFSANSAASATAMPDAPPLRSGARPDQCLDVIATKDRRATVERVESVIYAGRPALAYLVGTPQGRAVYVVNATTCAPETSTAL